MSDLDMVTPSGRLKTDVIAEEEGASSCTRRALVRTLTVIVSGPGLRKTGVFVAAACAAINLYMTQPLLVLLEQFFHASKAAAGLTVTASALAAALASPLIGAAADRIGRKRVIVPTIFMLAVVAVLATASTSLLQLTAWTFVQGLLAPAVATVTIAYITEEWKQGEVPSAMVVYVTGMALGTFIGRATSLAIAATYGWRSAFMVLGMLTTLGGLLTWRLLPPSTRLSRTNTSERLLAAVVQHLRNPHLMLTFALGSSMLFSLVAGLTYISFHLSAAPYSMSPLGLSALFSVYLVVAVVTPMAGRLISKVGFRLAYAVSMLVSAGSLLLTLSASLWLNLVGLATFCVFLYASHSAATSSLSVFAPQNRSTATGLYVSCFYMGGALGGYVPGRLWEYGGWNVCVALVVSVIGLAVAAALFLWKPEPKRSYS